MSDKKWSLKTIVLYGESAKEIFREYQGKILINCLE